MQSFPDLALLANTSNSKRARLTQLEEIKAKMNFDDLVITYSLDAHDFLESLRSVPSVYELNDHSLDFISSTSVRQTFDFNNFKIHADHQTLVTLNDGENSELWMCEEPLVTYWNLESENGEEELRSIIGVNLYDVIRKKVNRLAPTKLQLELLKDSLVLGLCEKLNTKPSEVMHRLYLEFMNDINQYDPDAEAA